MSAGPDKGPDVEAVLARKAADMVHRILLDSTYYVAQTKLDNTVRDLVEDAYLQGYHDAVEAQREAFNAALAGLIGERP